MLAALVQACRQVAQVTLLENEPLARHTSFGIGGPADLLAIPHTTDALRELMRLSAEHHSAPPLIIGNGTNLLVRDGGVRGLVIKLADNLSDVRREGNDLIALAGASLAKLCHQAADVGLAGMNFAAGIPGTIGGAVWMNAGAFGGCIGDLVKEVRACDARGQEVVLGPEELGFGYRHSSLQGSGLIVLQVRLGLAPGDSQVLHAELCETIEKRCVKQPVAAASAGSIFKRPPDDFAGRLVEAVGAKGLKMGGAEISPKHANFIVNTGRATAHDVLGLIELVRQKVHEQHGVWLEPEVLVVGED